MQSKKKTILAVAALVVIAAVLLLVWRAVTPKGEAGEKTITVQVLHKGGEERVFTLETGEAYLGAVLTAEGVVEDNQGPYGLYMLTVDGETVDEALKLTNKAVVEALEGLPPIKVHCSVLAEQAVKAALSDYYRRQGIDPEPIVGKLEEDCDHCESCGN